MGNRECKGIYVKTGMAVGDVFLCRISNNIEHSAQKAGGERETVAINSSFTLSQFPVIIIIMIDCDS